MFPSVNTKHKHICKQYPGLFSPSDHWFNTRVGKALCKLYIGEGCIRGWKVCKSCASANSNKVFHLYQTIRTKGKNGSIFSSFEEEIIVWCWNVSVPHQLLSIGLHNHRNFTSWHQVVILEAQRTPVRTFDTQKLSQPLPKTLVWAGSNRACL